MKMLRYVVTRLFFMLFALFVVAPLTLMVWRGIWGLLDEYITTINDEVHITGSTYHPSTGCHFNITSTGNNLKDNHPVHSRKAQYNVWIIFMVGLTLRFAFEVSQHEVGDGIEHIISNFGFPIRTIMPAVTYLYMITNTIVTVALWRGQWLLLDELANSMIGDNKMLVWYITLHAWVLCFALMIVVYLRSSISLIACPLGVASDRHEEVYNAPSLHNRTLTNHTFISFLCDIILSLLVICLSVSVWWACWRLFDDLGCYTSSIHTAGILNATPNKSHILWWSIVLGYILCGSVYCFQFVLKRGHAQSQQAPWYYHLCYYLLTLIGALGCICIWRGLWGAFDEWTDSFIPIKDENDIMNPENFMVTAFIAVVCLITLGCFNTTSSRGVRNLQAVIQEYQSSELLFEVEYRHPWCRPACCATWSESWNEYREIEEVNAEQTERDHRDENGNHRSVVSYTSERSDRVILGRQSPPHRGPSTEMAPLVLSD